MFIANVLGIKNISAPQHADIGEFLLVSTDDGELTFTNDQGETYIIVRKNKYLSLRHPFGDCSGDPVVVARFNRLNFAPLSVLKDA